MTSQDKNLEFRSADQLQLTRQLTLEQRSFLAEWAASVPTLYFLDICVVGATKLSEDFLAKNERKSKIVSNLRTLDRPQHKFSYLFALMEKVSDLRGTLSDSELEAQLLGDLNALRSFFKQAKVCETDEFVTRHLQELRRYPVELERSKYLEFLEMVNNQLELKDPTSPAHRLQKATEILAAADTLTVDKKHPVVILVLSCLYGNSAAKKLMKFKADPANFNAENVLSDIMAITRFARMKLQIEHLGRKGKGQFLHADFITDDAGLTGVINCFTPGSVKHEYLSDVCETSYKFTVKLKKLLSEIGEEEYEQLLDSLAPPGQDGPQT